MNVASRARTGGIPLRRRRSAANGPPASPACTKRKISASLHTKKRASWALFLLLSELLTFPRRSRGLIRIGPQIRQHSAGDLLLIFFREVERVKIKIPCGLCLVAAGAQFSHAVEFSSKMIRRVLTESARRKSIREQRIGQNAGKQGGKGWRP